MKILIVLLIIISTQANAIEQDKAKHFAASAVIGGVSQYYFNNWRYSSVVCLSAGIIKELTDSIIDRKDLLYDAVGCSFGILSHNAESYIINIIPTKGGAMAEINFKF